MNPQQNTDILQKYKDETILDFIKITDEVPEIYYVNLTDFSLFQKMTFFQQNNQLNLISLFLNSIILFKQILCIFHYTLKTIKSRNLFQSSIYIQKKEILTQMIQPLMIKTISKFQFMVLPSYHKIITYLLPMKQIQNETITIFQLACLRKDLKFIDYLLKDEEIFTNIDFQDELTQDLVKDPQIQQIIKNHQDSKLQYQYLVKVETEQILQENNIFLGVIFKLSNIFSRLKIRYIEVNTLTRTFTRYKKKSHYPLMPNGLPINLDDIVSINQYNASWFKKKDKFYFEIVTDKERQVYFTQFESTMVKWICIFQDAKKNFEDNKRENFLEIIDQPGNYLELPNETLLEIENSWNLNYNDIISQEINLFSQQEYQEFINQKFDDQALSHKSFEFLRELGRGAFGDVYLVKKKDDGQILALKTQQKKNLLLKKKLHYIISEAEIMKKLDHPFIMQMLYIFQTPLNIYFAMEYCPGIDLLKQLHQYKKFTEDQARFYLCELVLAIQYLHQQDIIFRDLKPENILLDKDGHIKLTDFGLAKQNIKSKQQSNSICGTPAYVSPEILNQIGLFYVIQGASQSSDIYGIGGVLYELLVGEPPFLDYDLNTMFDRIKDGNINFPKSMSYEAKDIISQMMNVDPQMRLGFDNFQDILNHKFFENINWDDVYNKKLLPPIVPKIGFIQTNNKVVFEDFEYNEINQGLNKINNLTFIHDKK